MQCLFCHFFIAFSAATVYLTASRWIPFLLMHAVISGAFYGVAVYYSAEEYYKAVDGLKEQHL
jgi:hypothetical protein